MLIVFRVRYQGYGRDSPGGVCGEEETEEEVGVEALEVSPAVEEVREAGEGGLTAKSEESDHRECFNITLLILCVRRKKR